MNRCFRTCFKFELDDLKNKVIINQRNELVIFSDKNKNDHRSGGAVKEGCPYLCIV